MNRDRYPVSVMSRFFGVLRNGCYDYVKRLDQPVHDRELAAIIGGQQRKCDKTYGYRRMWKMSQQLHKYENRLDRNFQADRPNHKWVTDISFIHTG